MQEELKNQTTMVNVPTSGTVNVINNKLTWSKELYDKIQKAVEDLPKEAMAKATKEQTKKGYDTVGYQHQYLINILNETIGVNCWHYTWKLLHEKMGAYKSGTPFNDITVEVVMTILDETQPGIGGHISITYADALKGAITNAMKKALSFFGIGRKAYEGTLDEDYTEININEVKEQFKPLDNYTQKMNELQNKVNSPKCPKCGADMKLKNRKDGSGQFWGCSTYPNCSGIVSADKPQPQQDEIRLEDVPF